MKEKSAVCETRPPARVIGHFENDGFAAWWALLGLLWTAFAIYGTADWFLSGQAVPVSIQGPDDYAPWRLIGMRSLEGLSLLFVAYGAYAWIVRPWLDGRGLILEGMLLIGGCVGFFMDPVINIFEYTFAWNQHAINIGTWAHVFPAWKPQGAYAEGLAWAFPQYIMMSAGAAVFGTWIVCTLQARYPRISLPWALTAVFAVHFVADFIVENSFIFFHVYAFARTHGAVTLFAGQVNQFPLYESALVAAQAVPLTLLMMSARNSPDGLSFVERGAQYFPAPLQKTVRCLAVIGFAFFIFAMYFFPSSWLSVTADSVIQLPSYLWEEPLR